MNRIGTLSFGVATYAVFFACFAYSIAFIGDFALAHTLDRGGPVTSQGLALAINLAVLSVFAIQHSLMARPAFKRVWTRIIGRPIERSVYVLASVGALALIYTQWRPMPGVVWQAEAEWARTVLWAGYAGGWAMLFWATCMLDHFELFGLRQVIRSFTGADEAPKTFRTPALYRIVRHPIYVGWAMIFWITPTMTVGHLLFAVVTTGYMLVAIPLEERDLIAELGDPYRNYRNRVPALIPRLRRPARSPTASAPPAELG